MSCPSPPQTVLIIGGGEFGLGAAAALLEIYAGQEHLIMLLDPSKTPPCEDAASSDHNKIIRSDYSDDMYANLARRSLKRWRADEMWSKYYYESGIVVCAELHSKAAEYVKKSLNQNVASAHELKGSEAVKSRFTVETGAFEDMFGYFNESCGWADARGAMDALCSKVRSAGVTFHQGKAVELLTQNERVIGAKLEDGQTLLADFTIVAAGSWTSRLLPGLGHDLLSSGQIVGTIQLTKEDADRYRHVPVVFSMDSGFYVFPPTENNIIKFAIHSGGYVYPLDGLPSTPRTKRIEADQNMSDNIPRSAITLLKQELAKVYPELARKTWNGSRLCWYTETPSSNFLIDFHPDHAGTLFIASGGSGHGFKFAPIMSDLILGSLQKTLPSDHAEAWSFKALRTMSGDPSRGGVGMAERQTLDIAEMANESHF